MLHNFNHDRLRLLLVSHPIIADPVYHKKIQLPCTINPTSQSMINELRRQFLHAVSLKFNHPINNTPLTFESPYPQSLAELITQLEHS